MIKKNIGILFPSSKNGGVFQYALSIIDSLISYCEDFDYTILHYEGEKPELFSDSQKILLNYTAIKKSRSPLLRKMIHLLGLVFKNKAFIIKDLDDTLKSANINLLIVPTPFLFNIPLSTPYIVSIPDYMDKYYPYFPEYSFRTKLARDIFYKYYGEHSVLSIADSEQGADDINKFSSIDKRKIRVIHYIPPSYVYKYKDMDKDTIDRLLTDYNLPEKFIFYPAQFWFQKNHARLIKALYLIKEKYKVKIPIVLVGNSKGNKIYERVYRELMNLAKKLNITKQVIHLGYTENKETVALYKKAIALVAPPFQGPTTIPPLEAMILGTPVVTVNLFDVQKQVGNAGILFDPLDEKDMAEKIYKVWQDANLRKKMVEHGYKMTKNITQKNYAKKWENIIKEALL